MEPSHLQPNCVTVIGWMDLGYFGLQSERILRQVALKLCYVYQEWY